MRKATDKNKIKKIIIGVISLILLISPLSFLFAEDYPAGYLGPGYREYLSDKKQNGYYVEEFTRIDLRQKERVNKRNQVEEILAYAYQAAPEAANGILATASQHKYNTDNLRVEIANLKQQREKNASAQGEFTYIPYSDGKIVYFKDGLVNRVVNERVVDEFGNVNYRNSYNYQYNDKRLLISFEADIKDILGNITHIRQFGMQYTADSLFYGGKDTNANRNLTEYFVEETDPAGNKKLTHFYGASYEGKLLRAFSQTIEDSIYGNSSFTRTNITYAGNDPEQMSSYHEEGRGTDGLAYTLDRTNITYNGKDQITGYHDEIWTVYPAPEDNLNLPAEHRTVKTIVDAQFKYLGPAQQFGPDVEEPDPDKLLVSIVTTTTINPDGSQRTETATTTYDYDASQQLIGGLTISKFTGQEADWWEYTDGAGHTLSKNVDEEGNITYSYVDPDTHEIIIVPGEQVTATKQDGNTYSGTSETKYEVLYGKPMASQINSTVSYYAPDSLDLVRTDVSTVTYNNGLVNNLRRVLDTQEQTNVTYSSLVDLENNLQTQTRTISTTYIYANNGNLIDAMGQGTGSGYELTDEGWKNYTSTIEIDYEVILGLAKQMEFKEIKDYER